MMSSLNSPATEPQDLDQLQVIVSPTKQKQAWWKRSVVRRTAAIVENQLEAIAAQSSFLQQPPVHDNSDLVFLDRSEIHVGEQLGQGAFSVVYEIDRVTLNPAISNTVSPQAQDLRQYFCQHLKDTQGNCRYAMKHLQHDLVYDKHDYVTAATDLALEVAYLSRLQHEHILPLRGLPVAGLQALENGQHDGYFLILDKLTGTLQDQIQEWAVTEQETDEKQEQEPHRNFNGAANIKMEYSRQLASALNYLHQFRIVFRDLKPQNIGFNSHGQIQLFDFGLARDLPADEEDWDGENVYEMSGVGTRRYMAPEVVRDGMYNCKADVYGWSMVVYQMFSLTKPYPDLDIDDHADFVCCEGQRPTNLTKVPVHLQPLLRDAWQQSVEERCDMEDVVYWFDYLAQENCYNENIKTSSSLTFLYLQQKVLGVVQSMLPPTREEYCDDEENSHSDDDDGNAECAVAKLSASTGSLLATKNMAAYSNHIPCLLRSTSSGFSDDEFDSSFKEKARRQAELRRCPAA